MLAETQSRVSPRLIPPAPSTGGKVYLLISLAVLSMTSWADRAAFNLLIEPIKRDLNLTDTQIGLLGGVAFAALYATLSIPIARIAERKNRLTITFIAVSLWSLATMSCAACANFWQLALARAGVGVGESACLPCAQSMISDTYPPERRSSAISIFSLGIPIGTVIGIFVGAWVAELYSWRAAFVAVGAPGLVFALIGMLTLKEPYRGRYDPPVSEVPPKLIAVVKHLWSRRAYRHLTVGAAVGTMLNAGIGAFLTPYVLRSKFGLQLTDMAMLGLFLTGVGTFTGVLLSGPLSDFLARKDKRWTLWVPAAAFFVAAPIWVAAFLTNSLVVFVFLALVGQTAMAVYPSPTFGALNNMAEPRMRATAVAIMGVFNGFIGLGLGPVLVGVVSDLVANSSFLVPASQCAGRTACNPDNFLGLRAALAFASVLYLWPAAHYFLAGFGLRDALISDGADHPPEPLLAQ